MSLNQINNNYICQRKHTLTLHHQSLADKKSVAITIFIAKDHLIGKRQQEIRYISATTMKLIIFVWLLYSYWHKLYYIFFKSEFIIFHWLACSIKDRTVHIAQCLPCSKYIQDCGKCVLTTAWWNNQDKEYANSCVCTNMLLTAETGI